MARPRRPLFLRPEIYRQRRLRDAARALPVLGVVLLLVPLLWTPSNAPGGVGNSRALLYVFGVWAGLIAGVHLLSRILRLDPGEDEDDPS